MATIYDDAADLLIQRCQFLPFSQRENAAAAMRELFGPFLQAGVACALAAVGREEADVVQTVDGATLLLHAKDRF